MLNGVFRWDKDNQCVCVVYIVYTDIEAGIFDRLLRSTPLTSEIIAKSTFNLPDLELLEYYCRANAPHLVFYDNKMERKFMNTKYMLKFDTTSFKRVLCTDDGTIYYVDDVESMSRMPQGLKYLLHNPAMIDLTFKSQ